MNKKGLFITFEGIDGCGKTTQINLLNEYLKNKKYNTILTFEPGDCEIGKNLRKILLHHDGYISDTCELLMYLADRAQHVETIILDNINKGNIVLCDRYTASTVSYQGYARGGNLNKINTLNQIATNGLEPDLTFVFDINPEIAQTRVGKEKDRLEKESLDFHNKVRNGFLEQAKNNPKMKVINSSQPIEKIFEEVKEIINTIL